MKLPLLISVPHAGLRIPDEAKEYCRLTADQVREDGDEGAAEIYAVANDVEAFVTTDIARAIVDLNRAEDDRRPDGVVKTHTCLNVPVYDPFPPDETLEKLLEQYYRPYHRRLKELAGSGVRLGIDGHTMLAIGPPIGPMAGRERPKICLGNADGATCTPEMLHALSQALEVAFETPVSLNDPFKGGHITRSHASELPWVQIEISRAPFFTDAEKRERVLGALTHFCRLMKF